MKTKIKTARERAFEAVSEVLNSERPYTDACDIVEKMLDNQDGKLTGQIGWRGVKYAPSPVKHRTAATLRRKQNEI